jgi:hypothetical protein
MCAVGVASTRTTFTPSFHKISQLFQKLIWTYRVKAATRMQSLSSRLGLKSDGTRVETRFRLSPKRTSPFKSAGASVLSTAGSRGVRIGGSNAGYTTFRGSVRVLVTHSIRQFPLHFPSRASPCAIRFQTHSISLHFALQHAPHASLAALRQRFLEIKNSFIKFVRFLH